MTAYQPVRAAFHAWQRTQPQLFIELPEATHHVSRPSPCVKADALPAAQHQTGSGRATSEKEAAGARQETL